MLLRLLLILSLSWVPLAQAAEESWMSSFKATLAHTPIALRNLLLATEPAKQEFLRQPQDLHTKSLIRCQQTTQKIALGGGLVAVGVMYAAPASRAYIFKLAKERAEFCCGKVENWFSLQPGHRSLKALRTGILAIHGIIIGLGAIGLSGILGRIVGYCAFYNTTDKGQLLVC